MTSLDKYYDMIENAVANKSGIEIPKEPPTKYKKKEMLNLFFLSTKVVTAIVT